MATFVEGMDVYEQYTIYEAFTHFLYFFKNQHKINQRRTTKSAQLQTSVVIDSIPAWKTTLKSDLTI